MSKRWIGRDFDVEVAVSALAALLDELFDLGERSGVDRPTERQPLERRASPQGGHRLPAELAGEVVEREIHPGFRDGHAGGEGGRDRLVHGGVRSRDVEGVAAHDHGRQVTLERDGGGLHRLVAPGGNGDALAPPGDAIGGSELDEYGGALRLGKELEVPLDRVDHREHFEAVNPRGGGAGGAAERSRGTQVQKVSSREHRNNEILVSGVPRPHGASQTFSRWDWPHRPFWAHNQGRRARNGWRAWCPKPSRQSRSITWDFEPKARKLLVVRGNPEDAPETFTIRDIGSPAKPFSQERPLKRVTTDILDCMAGDFSEIDREGMYQVAVGDELSRALLHPARRLAAHTAQSRRLSPLQRCGVAVPEVHPACHLDDARRRDNGEHVDVTGGWHDAGDLRKWMTATQMNARRAAPPGAQPGRAVGRGRRRPGAAARGGPLGQRLLPQDAGQGRTGVGRYRRRRQRRQQRQPLDRQPDRHGRRPVREYRQAGNGPGAVRFASRQ